MVASRKLAARIDVLRRAAYVKPRKCWHAAAFRRNVVSRLVSLQEKGVPSG